MAAAILWCCCVAIDILLSGTGQESATAVSKSSRQFNLGLYKSMMDYSAIKSFIPFSKFWGLPEGSDGIETGKSRPKAGVHPHKSYRHSPVCIGTNSGVPRSCVGRQYTSALTALLQYLGQTSKFPGWLLGLYYKLIRRYRQTHSPILRSGALPSHASLRLLRCHPYVCQNSSSCIIKYLPTLLTFQQLYR